MQLPHDLTLLERLSPRTARVCDASGRELVLKCVPEWATEYAEARASIAREARILEALRGRQISADVHLYDPRTGVLLLDWLPGNALDLGVKRSEAELLHLARGLFDLLVRLHDNETWIVHADLSPGNIIQHGTRLRLIDFELALASDLAEQASLGAFRGTAHYAAPEVARSESPTPASDVFACGAIVLACALGTAPRRTTGPGLLVEAAESRLHVPETLGATLRRLLVQTTEMQPKDRPSAKEALQLLGA
jgi:eukaryotic-like serine/threonine-protein kinase